MYLRRRALSRRMVLRGAGAAIGLPLLDAMVPAATALAQTAAVPRLRAGFFYMPHGAILWNTAHGHDMDMWTPRGSGEDFTLSPIMSPLERYKSMVTSFGELNNAAAEGAVHSLNAATWLSGAKPDLSITGASMAPTIDQLIAQKIGQDTPLPSLEVAGESTLQWASCAGAGGCYYSSTLSFRNANTPLPMEYNPRKVFIQLFGEGDTPEQREAVYRQTDSLLDRISESTGSLARELSAADRVLLSDYLENVREIERRVQISSATDYSGLELPAMPIGELDSFDDQLRVMFDLIALAYQADLTRVASYFMVSETTYRTYSHIGVRDAFHAVSHHADDIDKIQRVARIQTYHMERFAEFLDKLAGTPDGDGSLLDHSMLLYGSGMSNSDKHNAYPLPNILVGGACGALPKGGRHIGLPERTPHANLLLTVLNKAGVERESLADSTGLISEMV